MKTMAEFTYKDLHEHFLPPSKIAIELNFHAPILACFFAFVLSALFCLFVSQATIYIHALSDECACPYDQESVVLNYEATGQLGNQFETENAYGNSASAV